MKTTRRFAAAFAVIALVCAPLFNADAANAAPVTPTLTYDELKASQGYQDLLALAALSNAAYEALPGIEINTTIHATITSASTLDTTVNVKSNKTDATSTTVTQPAQGVVGGTTNYYFSNGHYLFDAKTYGSAFKDNSIDDGLKRLGKSADTIISTNLTTPPAKLVDISPVGLSSKVSQDGLSNLSLSGLGILFTPIVCAPSVDAPNTKVCSYSGSATVAGAGSLLVNCSLTFDATGLMTNLSLAETTDPAGFEMIITATQAPLTGWTQTLPQSIVTDKTAVGAGRQVNAETISTSYANKVIDKAKALAKKAHKPLDATYLIKAAKTLGQKVTKIKGGIKVTNKWLNVPGSACAVVSKGKAAAKPC